MHYRPTGVVLDHEQCIVATVAVREPVPITDEVMETGEPAGTDTHRITSKPRESIVRQITVLLRMERPSLLLGSKEFPVS